MIRKRNERGFSIIELLALLVIVGLLGFTGWFVLQSKHNTEQSQANATKSTTPKIAKTVISGTYESPHKEFTIMLADGWKLYRYQDSAALYTFNPADLKPQSGMKPVVTQVEDGKDGNEIGLSMVYEAKAESTATLGVKQASLTTNDGLEVSVYKYTNTPGAVDANAADIPNGATEYKYLVTSPKGALFVVWYGITASDANYHEGVEASIKTLHFN